ncbi:MAG: hypothetical protein FJY92_05565 [Candidatus Hydrogenedentes bacterium]|nr:hypothetical protein [Candidatus Hydrogenedentota bacterium]
MNETHPLLDALLVASLLWPGTAYGRRLAQRGLRLTGAVDMRMARGLVALAATFIVSNLLLLSIRSYPAVSWYLPVSIEYCATPGLFLLNIASMTFAFSAVSALAFSHRHPARWFVPLACIGVFAIVEFQFRTSPLVRPPEVRDERTGAGGVVLQTSGATCGAAACASVTRLLGAPKTEREMAALLGTTEAGTSPAQIVVAMRGLGFTCTKRYVPERDLSQVRAPAILFVAIGTEVDAHAVALANVTGSTAAIWDPSGGKHDVDVRDFSTRWGGRAIEIAKK